MSGIHARIAGSAVIILLTVSGCTQEQGSGATNIRTVTKMIFEKGWSDGDYSVFSETVADTVVFHYSNATMQLARDQMTGFVASWREGFPDLRMEVRELLAEEQIAAVRLTLSGTHEGPWAGAEPTGRTFSMPVMMFLRFENARMVEVWECDDKPGLYAQLGIPAPPAGPGDGGDAE